MKTNEDGLKPCPFCLSTNTNLICSEYDHGYIQCGDCLAQGPLTDQIGNWRRPKNTWNTRAEQTAVEPIEGLESALSRTDARILELDNAGHKKGECENLSRAIYWEDVPILLEAARLYAKLQKGV